MTIAITTIIPTITPTPQDVLDTVWATLDVSGVTNMDELNRVRE